MKKLGLTLLIALGSISCYAQILPNCLTPDEAKLVNLALEERYSMIQQLFICDSTIHELTIQNHDYRNAMVSFKKESAYYQNALKESDHQKELLIKNFDKMNQIMKERKKKATKGMIGWGIGGLAIGVMIPTIIMLVK